VPALPYLAADEVAAALSWGEVVAALRAALSAGLALDSAPPRTRLPVAHGELMLMPAEMRDALGVKVLGIAPRNADQGLPSIHAVYLLLDPTTLVPVLALDGTALTELRTAGQSTLAIGLLVPQGIRRLVVFGTGPQARAHIAALAALQPLESVLVVGRVPERAQAFCATFTDLDVAVCPGTAADVTGADAVVCATSSRTPLFDGRTLAATTCVVAVGSHEPDARELDDTVFSRAARVVVEHRPTALREAGDVIMAIGNGALHEDDLVELAAIDGDAGGIAVFKSVGMGWQDLAVAAAIHARR
jgi:ornithine cyclodeaminase/alanine dehydrogenase-like protein (mu-crystallin family)